ncbi:hypothetical protein AB1K54_13325 [Microbacterium sp. BWT-B31]|uniref:hypothetical protein n=1 Tax=Microbacterium sp. BWT-B31 TaxID=3232072 RepID=UPI003527027D
MPEADRNLLRITGVFEAPGSGYTAELDYGNAGVAPEPDLLALTLKTLAPPVGSTVLTAVPVFWEGQTDGGIRSVRIHTPDGATYVAVQTLV